MSSGALTPTNRDPAFSGWLDLFRALAAFAVLLGHARALFLTSTTGAEPVWLKPLYLLSGYGHQAVMVFFVLSGYLVGGTVIRASRDGRWSWGDYLLRRGTRLYIVLIPALLLTLCWDYGEGIRSAGVTPNGDTGVANIRSETIREHTSVAAFAGNLAFLQKVMVPPLGSNTPLWSLANEFWYYLVFPLLWIAVTDSGRRWYTRAIYLGLAALILCLVGSAIALYLTIWLLGVIVALLPERGWLRILWPRRLLTGLLGGAFVAALLAVVVIGRNWPQFARDLVVGATFASFLYCLKHNHGPAKSATFRRSAGFFADFSYTLYAVHLPPLIFLRACLTYETSWPASASSWVLLAVILAGVVLYAYLISLVTERQTEVLRRWLSKLPLRAKRAGDARVPVGVS